MSLLISGVAVLYVRCILKGKSLRKFLMYFSIPTLHKVDRDSSGTDPTAQAFTRPHETRHLFNGFVTIGLRLPLIPKQFIIVYIKFYFIA
jgi:hypothetical protein